MFFQKNIFAYYIVYIMLYSILGWVYESIYCSIVEKRLINRGFLNGPYCPIYGFGAVFDILLIGDIKNPFLLFLLGAIVTCSLEYITSFIMEKLFNARWWDYSTMKYNINGRVCLLGAVVFGVFSVVLIKFIHPQIIRFVDNFNYFFINILAIIIFIMFTTDAIITIIGISDLNVKLKKLQERLEELKLEKKKLYIKKDIQLFPNSIKKHLNYQERRMIDVFPKFSSNDYNEVVLQIKNILRNIKSLKKDNIRNN